MYGQIIRKSQTTKRRKGLWKRSVRSAISLVLALVFLLSTGSIAAMAANKTPDFKQYLADERIPVDPPQKLVNDNGKANFGTFNAEIPNINL